MERTVIFYHGHCPDGFGGAYAAWKKFGGTAEYIPLSDVGVTPPDVTGAHVYFIDFVYPQEIMDAVKKQAASLVALDHHIGVREVTESMPEHVFDNDRSGATIAWNYFHPNIPVPVLLTFIEDDDLFLFKLPDTRSMLAYISVQPFTFEVWDDLAMKLDDPVGREILLEKARSYGEYFSLLADLAVANAKLVHFEGYECAFATAHPFKPMKSLVGNLLAKKYPPIALVVTAHPNGYGVSIRGDGTVDVSKIAQKYGGNGHKSSAGFMIPREGPFPWELTERNEGQDNISI